MRYVGFVQRSDTQPHRLGIVLWLGNLLDKYRKSVFFDLSLVPEGIQSFRHEEVVTFEVDCERDGNKQHVVRLRHFSEETEWHTLADALIHEDERITLSAAFRICELVNSPDQGVRALEVIEQMIKLKFPTHSEPLNRQHAHDIARSLFESTDRRVWGPATKPFLLRFKLSDFSRVREDTSTILCAKARELQVKGNENDINYFWQELRQYITYETQLYKQAPPKLKHSIVADEFAKQIAIAKECLTNQSSVFAFDSKSVYTSITADDERLAQKWASPTGDPKNAEFEKIKMLSARCAEKVAIEFYQRITCTVEDVSIHQLNGESEDWKNYDLFVDNRRPVDVKNARTPVGSTNHYVQHCVPKFKESRNLDVAIAGVLSPYVTVEKWNELRNGRQTKDFANIKFLGETNRYTIRWLQHRFCTQQLTVMLVQEGKHIIPEWLFDYPPEFYGKRDDARRNLKEVSNRDQPTLDEFKGVGINPLPAFISAGITLPDSWRDALPKWKQQLYSDLSLQQGGSITLPFVFLSLLTHFIQTVTTKSPPADYRPISYRDLLVDNTDATIVHPLGIADPLGTIDSFVKTLDNVWKHRARINFSEFESYRFDGLGLLRGTRRGSGEKVTIIAYCGGSIPGKGKCGCTPLIMGIHETCPNPKCGKLICKRCNYCDLSCPENKDRSKGARARYDSDDFEGF